MATTTKRDYYEVLGVAKDADEDACHGRSDEQTGEDWRAEHAPASMLAGQSDRAETNGVRRLGKGGHVFILCVRCWVYHDVRHAASNSLRISDCRTTSRIEPLAIEPMASACTRRFP